jgi:vacuolar-type H+-ATPase subunit C/Vma6
VGKANDYALAVGLVGALRSFMLTPTHYEMMLRIRNPSKILIPLKETCYQSVLPEASEKAFEVESIERALFIHYYEIFRKILTVAPPHAKPLLEAVFRKHELTCLKTIIRLLAQGIKPIDALSMIIPLGRYDSDTCKLILSTRSVLRIVDFIKESDLREAILSYMTIFRKTGSTIPIEATIDKYALSCIWEVLPRLKEYDRRIASHLIGIEIDTTNIMTILRAKRIGMETIDIEGLVIPIHYRITSNRLAQAVSAPSLAETMKRLSETLYWNTLTIPSEDVEKTLFEVEMRLKRYLAQENMKVFRGDRFHIGILLGFLNLKFYEITDLIAIINGKIEGVGAEDIRTALILHGI